MDYFLRKNSLIFLLSCIVFWCWFYLGIISKKANVELGLEVSRNSTFEISWAKQGQGYTKDKRMNISVHPDSKHYSFILTDLTESTKLRITPMRYQGEAKFLYLNIHQHGFLPVELSGLSGLDRLQPSLQVDNIRLDKSGLKFLSLANDPGFEFYLQPGQVNYSWLNQLVELVFLIVATWMIGICCSSLLIRHRYVLLLLAGAWVVIWVMTVISKPDSHPDEYVHSAAVYYYQYNWLPPKYEDPAIVDTYSPYGNSRLNYYEIYYLIAGKFQQFVSRFVPDELSSMRLFNMVLFGVILLLAVPSPHIRVLAVPFLLSPQVWYLFSYCNSEGFALFVCFIAAFELTYAGSIFYRYLKKTSIPRLVLSALYLGCLFGVLLLLKKNYYIFIAFAVLFVLIRPVAISDRSLPKTVNFRLLVIVLIGTALFAGRIGADYYVNGADREEKLVAIKEATAHYRYKPSTPADKRISSISLKEQGLDFKTMVNKSPWFEKTFESSFGVYGYTSIVGSKTYYRIIKTLVATLLLFFLLSIVLRGSNTDRLLVLAMIVLSTTLVYACLYTSWTVDFQPQGRYLLAIIPVLSILYGSTYRLVNRTVMVAGILAVYTLSLYSFICYGLAQIPKVAS